MIKKVRFITLIVFVLFSVALLGGCGGGGSTGGTEATQGTEATGGTEAAAEKISGDFIMATGGTSGTYYPLGGAMCQILKTATGANINANATGASVENVRLLERGEADLAIVQTDIMSYAVSGINNFEQEVKGVKSIGSLYPEVVHVVVGADSGINSIEDLKGKKVSVGAAGSGTEINAQQFFEAYNMTYKDIDPRYLSFAESATAFQDGTIDAFFCVAGTPNAAIVELKVSRDIKLVSLDKEHQDALIAKYPFFAAHTVSKDVYGMVEDGQTLAIKALLIVREDMTEQEVYLLTKGLYDNLDDLGEAHAKGKEITLEKAMEGVVPGNLHPGAAKYFQEKGIATP